MVLNEIIGNFGKYQVWLCSMIFISKFGVAFHLLGIIFLAPPVKYTCPNPKEVCCENPIYNKTEFIRTIITEWHLICGRSWLKHFTETMFQFGVLSGSWLLGMASDRFGRRPTLLFSVILEIFMGLMTSFLPDYWSFTIIRMLLGFSIGGMQIVGYVLVMEYIGHKYRGLISTICHIPFACGLMLLALFGYLIRDYVYFQLIISLTTFMLLSYICILPESPRWLMAVDRVNEALNIIKYVAEINNRPTENIEQKINSFIFQNHSARSKRGTVLDLFRSPHLRRNILVMAFNWLVCSYCLYGMSHYISHLAGPIYLNVLGTGGVCFAACFLAIPLILYVNRKTVMMISHSTCSLCLLVIAIMPPGIGSTIVGYIGIMLNFVAFIVIYLYSAEMFPTVVRSASMGFCSMLARLGAMVAPFVVGLASYGKWCAPTAFGLLPVVAAGLCLLLPETKHGKLLTTIEQGEALGHNTSHTHQVMVASAEVT